MRLPITTLLLLAVATLASSCLSNDTFEKNLSIENRSWAWGETYTFEVNVTESDTAADYNLYINARHTSFYPKSNLWLNVRTVLPSGETLSDRLELPIASPEGKWNGVCTGDICFLSKLMAPRTRMREIGKYSFEFEQDMRDSVLQEIIGIGLRIEKIAPRTAIDQ